MANAQSYSEAIPGLIVGLATRQSEISLCLRSKCDTHILKVEQVLMHLGFILGFASPSLLVYSILRHLLTNAVTGLGPFLDGHRNFEKGLRLVVPIFEQLGLGKLWDFVRDSCICMRFNDCTGDFFGQLNNIKLHVCDVRDPFDDMRRISTCEHIFNDSPLIALSFGMIVLAMIAFVNNQPPHPPPNQPAAAPAN